MTNESTDAAEEAEPGDAVPEIGPDMYAMSAAFEPYADGQWAALVQYPTDADYGMIYVKVPTVEMIADGIDIPMTPHRAAEIAGEIWVHLNGPVDARISAIEHLRQAKEIAIGGNTNGGGRPQQPQQPQQPAQQPRQQGAPQGQQQRRPQQKTADITPAPGWGCEKCSGEGYRRARKGNMRGDAIICKNNDCKDGTFFHTIAWVEPGTDTEMPA